MRSFPICVLLLCCSFPLFASEPTGTKITVRHISGSSSARSTLYLQSDRKRIEYRGSTGYSLGPHLASITRCDLGQRFELNLDSSQYESMQYPPELLTSAPGAPKTSQSEKPTVRVEVKTVDTGERKQLFGRTARHVITTTKETSLEGAQSPPYETIRDGWYVDLSQTISCDPEYMRTGHSYVYASLVVRTSGGSQRQTIPKPEFVTIGKPETGFALQEVTNPGQAYQFKTLVTEFQEGPLDPALFEVPHGFKQVKQIERTPPQVSSPVAEIWEWAKYKVANWFNLD